PLDDVQTTGRVTQVVIDGAKSALAGVRDLVPDCLPDGLGERRECLFHLARRLKSLSHVADAEPDALIDVVREWHRLALPVMRTKAGEATRRDLKAAWACVRHPTGRGLALERMAAAVTSASPPPAAGYTDEPTRKLLAVCRALDTLGWHGQ